MVFAVVFAILAAALGIAFVFNVRDFPADLLESALQNWNRRVRGFGWVTRKNDVEAVHPSSGALRILSIAVGIFFFVACGFAIVVATGS
jgi:hypothetical protein